MTTTVARTCLDGGGGEEESAVADEDDSADVPEADGGGPSDSLGSRRTGSSALVN